MAVKYFYGTNKQLLRYKFRVIDENESYYIVEDADTFWKFFIDKDTKQIVRAEDKSHEFVFKESGFVLSENEEEIKRIAKENLNEALTNDLKSIEDALSKNKMELADLSFDNTPDKELKDLNRDDEIIIIEDDKPHKGNVSRVLIDRDFPENIFVEVTCLELNIYYETIEHDDMDKTFYIEKDDREAFYGSIRYDVFLSENDYNKYLHNKKVTKINDNIASLTARKNRIKSTLNK